jgi:hypothetical protein
MRLGLALLCRCRVILDFVRLISSHLSLHKGQSTYHFVCGKDWLLRRQSVVFIACDAAVRDWRSFLRLLYHIPQGLDADKIIHAYELVEGAARDEVMLCGGSISHHHSIGKIRKGFMHRTLEVSF